MGGKQVRILFTMEDYQKLQKVKAFYGKSHWTDQAFIRWVIHQLYQKLPYYYEER